MKDKRSIRSRIEALLKKELSRRLEASQKRLPVLCQHNYRHPLDTRKAVDGEANPDYNQVGLSSSTIGLCMLGSETPDEWQGNICEDPIDAQRCPYFNPIQSKPEIIKEFQRQLADRAWLEANMPDVAALAWVLDLTPQIGFWIRIWFKLAKFLHRKVEPVREVPLLEALNENSRS